MTRADFAMLGRWLADPEVHRWWQHDSSPAAVERDFGPGVDGREPGEDLVALLDGRPVGLVQRARVGDYPNDLADFAHILGAVPRSAHCLDYLIGAAADRGHGLGAAMIDAASLDTFTRLPDTRTILISVVAAHHRSWRACERAGYRIVGTGDLPPENPLDDPAHHVLRRDR